MNKCRYNIGDRVVIVDSIDESNIHEPIFMFGVEDWLGQVVTIKKCGDGRYRTEECGYIWHENLIDHEATKQLQDGECYHMNNTEGFKYKVGDSVIIIDEGEIYDRYDEWTNLYAIKYTDSYMMSDVESISTDKIQGDIIARGEHLNHSEKMYLVDLGQGRLELVGENGIELMEERLADEVYSNIYTIGELVEGVEYVNENYSNLVFKITDDKLCQSPKENHWYESNIAYNRVLELEFIECEYNPKYGDVYYYPTHTNMYGYDKEVWTNTALDKQIKNAFGVYRTYSQAIDFAFNSGWLSEKHN